jgi:hypothetical protein
VPPPPHTHSGEKANRVGRDFGWEIAHGAVTRRPPISLYTMIPLVRRWGLGFVHRSRAIFCRAVPNLSVTIRTCFIAVRHSTPVAIVQASARSPTLAVLTRSSGTGGYVAGATGDAQLRDGQQSAAVPGDGELVRSNGARLARSNDSNYRIRETERIEVFPLWAVQRRAPQQCGQAGLVPRVMGV